MPKFWVCYRLHGPSEIDREYDIGDATILPGPRTVAGNLELIITADDLDDARMRAKEDIRIKSRCMVGALVFTVDEGLLLGDHYKIRPINSPNRTKTDSTLKVDQQILEVTDRIFRNIEPKLDRDDRTRRALNWYGFGLSTETPEDRIVAYWTGLEAAAEKQSQQFDYSDKQEAIIRDAKDRLLTTFGEEDSEFQDWVNGMFGALLRGSRQEQNDEPVKRILHDEIEQEYLTGIDDLTGEIEDIYEARNAIVHQGMVVDNPIDKANRAETILKELLLSRLSEAFDGFIGGGIPDREPYSIIIDPMEQLPIIFEDDESLELTTEEITARAFALCGDFREAYRFPVRNLAGDGEILTQVSENTYKLSST